MTNPTDLPESLAREIALDAAMLANTVRLMNVVSALVTPPTHYPWKSPPNQTVAEAHKQLTTAGTSWRRPLVMHFQGDFRDADLKRRLNMIGLSVYSTCTGEAHVRELRPNTRRSRLEMLRDEINRIERELADEEAEYVMDERAQGDDK